MAITSPLQLVTADPVPSTVEWRPLFAAPLPPVTLDTVQALQIAGLEIDVQYGPPELIEANQLAYRSFALVIGVPEDGAGLPFLPVVAMALVETAGGDSLLAVWIFDNAQSLSQAGQSIETTGYVQVSTLGGVNG